MQIGAISGQNRLSFLIILIAGLFVTGCSLSPSGGSDSASDTFEGAPTVRLFSPLPNQTFLEGTTVNIQARVENAGADVASVTIYLDEAVVGQAIEPNASGAATFSITQDWLTSVEGQYEISVEAARADGTTSERATVSVSVIRQAESSGSTQADNTAQIVPTPTEVVVEAQPDTSSQTTDTTADTAADTSADTAAPTQAPPATSTPGPPTNTPEPTATNTPSIPMALVISGANLRSGPNTVFEPPVGSIAANQEAEIVAVNPARDWYKIRYFNSTAWIFASLVTTTGDLSSLPVDAGPPTPIPATNTFTPVPVTPTPTPVPSQINLVVASIGIDPHPLVCQEASQITVNVTNNGSAGTENGGKIRIEAILVSTGATLETTETIFQPIAAGATGSATAFISVGTNFDELQRIRATIDTDGVIAESNESDNTSDSGTDYVLQKGGCG